MKISDLEHALEIMRIRHGDIQITAHLMDETPTKLTALNNHGEALKKGEDAVEVFIE